MGGRGGSSGSGGAYREASNTALSRMERNAVKRMEVNAAKGEQLDAQLEEIRATTPFFLGDDYYAVSAQRNRAADAWVKAEDDLMAIHAEQRRRQRGG